MRERSDVAILGAGPYGLSIAAHLRPTGLTFRIFGHPLQLWCEHMPNGMLLKSDGFASNLSDPAGAFTLERFCRLSNIPYHDTRLPVRLETFRAYGLAFQKSMVPELEDQEVTSVELERDGYRLRLRDGTTALASRLIVAVGINHFAHVPRTLMPLSREFLSHSSDVKEPERWRGRHVTVVGAGASAIDTAVLLKEAAADVTLLARRPSLKFAGPPDPNGRSWRDCIRHPGSAIGPGWRSRLYCDFPWLFHRLPKALRLHLVARHLAPAAGYPMRSRFVGKVPAMLGYDIDSAEIGDGRVRLLLRGARRIEEYSTDHVVAATGYRVDLRRLTFLSAEIRSRLRSEDHTPELSPAFESSVPNLYFVGPASANSFGPMMRFACGSDWTARRITAHLAKQARELLHGSPASSGYDAHVHPMGSRRTTA